MPTPAPENTFKLIYTGYWSDFSKNPDLETQLTENKVPHKIVNIPHLVGMGGTADLIFYFSSKLDREITVLRIPHRPEIDSYSEEYFYFDIPQKEALQKDEKYWMDMYKKSNQLTVR